MIKNKKKVLIALIILIFIICVLVSSYIFYYKYKQSKIDIDLERTYVIERNNELDIEKLARNWIQGYTSQFSQKYIENYRELSDINISNISVLDIEKNIVRIDFTARLKDKSTTYFNDWGEKIGDTLNCKWVITFYLGKNSNDVDVFESTNRVTPEKYEEDKDKEFNPYEALGDYKLYEKEKIYENLQCTYKIEKGICYVTYDSGKTFVQVPIDLKTLTTNSNVLNKLRENTYQINPEKTYFVYGNDTTLPLSMTYSDDMGVTWNNIKIDLSKTLNSPYNSAKYVHFTNKNEGHIVIFGDRAMGRNYASVVSTKDGGFTWSLDGAVPGDTMTDGSSAFFINENVGFISSLSKDESIGNLYRTEDGGKTYTEILFQEGEILEKIVDYQPTWSTVYDTPEVPHYNEGVLTVLVSQGSDGDYKAGRTLARYTSDDLGKTWKYIDQVIMKPDPSEG